MQKERVRINTVDAQVNVIWRLFTYFGLNNPSIKKSKVTLKFLERLLEKASSTTFTTTIIIRQLILSIFIIHLFTFILSSYTHTNIYTHTEGKKHLNQCLYNNFIKRQEKKKERELRGFIFLNISCIFFHPRRHHVCHNNDDDADHLSHNQVSSTFPISFFSPLITFLFPLQPLLSFYPTIIIFNYWLSN